MRAFLATVDLVIRAASWAEACDALHALLTDQGIHADIDPVLVDWAYVPGQRPAEQAWPREAMLPDDWLATPEGERDPSLLFADRQHVEPMLILSNSHLGPEMRRLLESMAPGVIEYDWGWIVEVEAELSAVASLQAFARERGCLWIKFDRDGPVFDQLPAFDW
jgi:hypothetical protein